VRADIYGAPDEDVLVSQPYASRPWGGMARRATVFDHLLTYFAFESGGRQSGKDLPRPWVKPLIGKSSKVVPHRWSPIGWSPTVEQDAEKPDG
jgi:hypothetical protein